MSPLKRPSFARAAPTLVTALVLLWLTSSTSSGAPLPWTPRLPLELWLGSRSAAASATEAPSEQQVLAPPAAGSTALPPARDPLATRPFGAEIRSAAHRHELDPLFLAAVVEVESNFEADAVSSKGAVGLMQLMPVHFDATGRPFEPGVNLELGARFLGDLVQRFGDLPTALAAYHAGPGAVERAGGRAPYRSTVGYVERVLTVYDRYRNVAGGGAARFSKAAIEIAPSSPLVAALQPRS